ncbi:MAG: ABC transporter permease [Acidobacteriaceae bacterium]|nr:ABC transporter permease [Acidobacteriaceae bacterium]
MERLLFDLKFVLRSLSRSPLFTAVAVLSLALGIGANSAIFSLLDQVLLRSLPVKDPQQLLSLDWDGDFSGYMFGRHTFSYPMYLGFRNGTAEVFSGVIARYTSAVDVGWKGTAERTDAELVSGNYFEVLGVGSAVGRPLTPQDDQVRGASPYVVLSYGYWQKRFGGNPGVLNQTVDVNNHPMTVVGVLSPHFRGTDAGRPADIFVPLAMKTVVTPTWDLMDHREAAWLNILARLKPGISLKQAQAAADVVYRREQQLDIKLNPLMRPQDAKDYAKNKFTVADAAKGFSRIRESFSVPLVVLMAMVGTLLLIACGNVANLLVARAASRQREIAVRLSVGASAMAIIRMILVESLVLSAAGGALALLVASWSGSILLRVLPFETFANVISTKTDTRVLLFTLTLSVVTAALFGLVPALQVAKPDLIKTLKSEAKSVVGGQLKFRKAMVAAQIALSLLLLIGAGLFTRSLYNLMHTEAGMRTDHLLSFSVNPSLSGYSGQRSRQLFQTVQAKLASLPGVQAVSAAELPVLAENNMSMTTRAEGYRAREHEDLNPDVNHVLPQFFSTLGIPLVSGREFTDRDTFGAAKAAIVNESFVKYFFGGHNPLGRHIGFGDPETAKLDIEIVGVIKDIKNRDLKSKAERQVWTPVLQEEKPSTITFYMRTGNDPNGMIATARQTIRQLDARLPLYAAKTVDTQINETHYVDRLLSMLSAAFGALATILAAIGLYGVMAYTVARRTPELGIRMALGAPRGNVLRLVMREVVMLIAIGIGAALPLALALGRYLEKQLFQIHPNDPLTLLAATGLLTLVALTAGYIPAFRATRIDPVNALRWE